jgi:hypothetical protein
MLSVIFVCIKNTASTEKEMEIVQSGSWNEEEKWYMECWNVERFIIKICGGEIVVGKERTQLMDCTNFSKM